MKTLWIIIILSTLVSCERDESEVNVPCTSNCIEINGFVGEGENMQIPVGKVYYEFGWSKPASPLGDPGRLIAKGYAQEDGTFKFSFSPKEREIQGGKFYITLKKDNNYIEQDVSFYDIHKADTSYNLKLHLPSKAYVKVIYRDFYPTSTEDFFEAMPFYRNYNCCLWGLSMFDKNGKARNDFFFATDSSFSTLELHGTTAGDQYTYLTILTKKNGQRIDKVDSIYIAKGDTKTYEVKY